MSICECFIGMQDKLGGLDFNSGLISVCFFLFSAGVERFLCLSNLIICFYFCYYNHTKY